MGGHDVDCNDHGTKDLYTMSPNWGPKGQRRGPYTRDRSIHPSSAVKALRQIRLDMNFNATAIYIIAVQKPVQTYMSVTLL